LQGVQYVNCRTQKKIEFQLHKTEHPTTLTNDVLVHLPLAEGHWANSCSGLSKAKDVVCLRYTATHDPRRTASEWHIVALGLG